MSAKLINQHDTWELAERRLGTETDERRRQNLLTMIAHMRAEAAGDLEALMATVSPDACYHQWGSSTVDRAPKDYAAVRDYYAAVIDNDLGRIAHSITRLTVDQDSIATEGVLRIAYPGRALLGMGKQVDDPNAYYLYESQMAIVWEFDADGLVVAEDSYATGDGFAGMRKLVPAEVPEPVR